MDVETLMVKVNNEVLRERQRQNRIHGIQRQDYGEWLKILVEEIGEVAQAMQKGAKWSKVTDANDLYTECIHVAAVASAIAEQVRESETIKGPIKAYIRPMLDK